MQYVSLLAFLKSRDPQSQQMTWGVDPDLTPLAQDTAVEKWLTAQAFKKNVPGQQAKVGRPGSSEKGAGTDFTSPLVVSPTRLPSPHQGELNPEQLTMEPGYFSHPPHLGSLGFL